MTRSVANFSEVMDEEERQRRMQELQMVFTHIPIYEYPAPEFHNLLPMLYADISCTIKGGSGHCTS